MKKIALACLAITITSSLFPMHKAVFTHLGHPCLPREFYWGMYAGILSQTDANPESKALFADFIEGRLKMMEKLSQEQDFLKALADLEQGNSGIKSPKKEAYERAHMLFHSGKRAQAFLFWEYGKVSSLFFAFAARKNLGLRIEEQHSLETWKLDTISDEEFLTRFKSKYPPVDLKRVMLAEEIHAHNMFLDLARIKRSAQTKS